MRFGKADENDNLIRRINSAVKNDRVSHAYIFEAPGYVDKKRFAEAFAKAVLCPKHLGENCGECSICDKIDHGNHEDMIYICPDGGSVKDAAIMKMQEELKTKPFGSRHIAIVESSDTMTLRAQNRLLKTLEEPPGKSLIILLSENMENLAQTIQSRCVKYRINHGDNTNTDYLMEKAGHIVSMALNRAPFYRIKKETDDISGSREEAYGFLDAVQAVLRDMMMEGNKEISVYKADKLAESIYAAETARKQIREGVSPSYAIKNLMIVIGG